MTAEQFQTCESAVRKLTEPLGCVEMRVYQVVVEPGEVTTPHTHEEQEEVFVAQTDGQIAIEGEIHDVPEGGVVRVHPDTVRNLLNETEDETHVWLAFGAPPVGTVEDFGAYVLADGGDRATRRTSPDRVTRHTLRTPLLRAPVAPP